MPLEEPDGLLIPVEGGSGTDEGAFTGEAESTKRQGDERQEGTPLQWNRQKGGRRVAVPGGGGSESQEQRQIVEFIQDRCLLA